MAIQSFRDRWLEDFYFDDTIPRRAGWRELADRVRAKLSLLNAAPRIEDLGSSKGLGLHKLRGDYKGLWAVKVNNAWRVVFDWQETDEGPSGVFLEDYH